jgi:hypothetical protein
MDYVLGNGGRTGQALSAQCSNAKDYGKIEQPPNQHRQAPRPSAQPSNCGENHQPMTPLRKKSTLDIEQQNVAQTLLSASKPSTTQALLPTVEDPSSPNQKNKIPSTPRTTSKTLRRTLQYFAVCLLIFISICSNPLRYAMPTKQATARTIRFAPAMYQPTYAICRQLAMMTLAHAMINMATKYPVRPIQIPGTEIKRATERGMVTVMGRAKGTETVTAIKTEMATVVPAPINLAIVSHVRAPGTAMEMETAVARINQVIR